MYVHRGNQYFMKLFLQDDWPVLEKRQCIREDNVPCLMCTHRIYAIYIGIRNHIINYLLWDFVPAGSITHIPMVD